MCCRTGKSESYMSAEEFAAVVKRVWDQCTICRTAFFEVLAEALDNVGCRMRGIFCTAE